MYIKRSEATVSADSLEDTKASEARVHEFMRTMPGFRWAMLLRTFESPIRLAAVSMWLSPEQASAQDANTLGVDEETHGYDVATARGSMTPATHVAIVDWEVDDETASRFTDRWNAFYHAIEDRIGSRLLRDLDSPATYAGLHVMTDGSHLNPEMFGSPVSDADGMDVRPKGVRAFEVLLLTEA